jgi:3-hydroxyisobutyrate dehydrogenase
MQRIALLGLGAMGSGMAANWVKKGFPLTIYNRSPDKAKALVAAGATLAATPREAAAGAEIIVAVVADDDASRGLWLGADGALAGARRGAIAIESSTLTPDWVRELGAAAEAQGLRFLDAPLGGSRPAAAAGEVTFFVGGEAATLEAARPALAAVSVRINPMGAVGAGATWKLINNALIASQLSALAEALHLAARSGFDPKQTAALILAGAAASPIVQGKLPRMLERRFDDADFAVRLMLKDARYALALAESQGLPAEVLRGAAAAFARAEAKGLGDADVAAVAG